jgi:hypothetical protein
MAHRTQRQPRSKVAFSPAEWELLTSANEDWYGLWEATAGIRSTPEELTENEVLTITRNALRSLLDKKLIYLCWLNPHDNAEQPLAKRDAERLLADPANWEPPLSSEPYIAFAATPAGQRAWRTSKPPVSEPVR